MTMEVLLRDPPKGDAMEVTMTNWCIVRVNDKPAGIHLAGTVIDGGHTGRVTSALKYLNVEGKLCATQSGRLYHLGDEATEDDMVTNLLIRSWCGYNRIQNWQRLKHDELRSFNDG